MALPGIVVTVMGRSLAGEKSGILPGGRAFARTLLTQPLFG